MFGPDVKASLTLDELEILVRGADAIHELNSNPVNKDIMATDLGDVKQLFEKSVAVSKDLKRGTILKKQMLKALKPRSGIAVRDIEKVVNKRLARDVKKNTILTWDDVT
jgi:N-acetylneuraminate synthase